MMMDRRLKFRLALAVSLLASGSVFAQQTGLEAAQQKAWQWAELKSKQVVEAVILTDSLNSGTGVIYRFQVSPTGYIWVAGDYRLAPVLAYGFEGQDPSLTPGHPARSFLELYQREMEHVGTHPDAQRRPHPGWSQTSDTRLKSGNTDDFVAPMMEVLWGQGSGYNDLTPAHTPTGCVAVSMVQMMRHWEWPRQPNGQHSYTHDVYGDFAIDLDTVTFNWAGMPLAAPSPDIARAMYYTGIALHMNYAPDGSGASTSRAANLMESSFRFHEKARYISKDDFGATGNWVRVLKNELINGRPMIYRGQGTGGHAFNFDGFDGDYFHVNWGWSGSQNGYFLVSSLTPGSSNFSEAQGAVVNLFPDTMLMWDRPYQLRALASDSRVSIGWSGVFNSELAYHKVYRDGEFLGEAPQRFFTDTTALNDHTYSYTVSAVYRTDTADYESEQTRGISVQPAAGFVLPFEEDFEDGHAGWQIASSAYGFQYGTLGDLGLGSDTSNLVIGINSGQAGNNKLVSDYMISNGFNFEGRSHVVLSFDYAFRKWQEVDQLYLMYRLFENNEWIQFAELEPTKGFHDWVNHRLYLPQGALTENVQLAFFYTDNGGVGYGAAIDNISLYELSDPGRPDFSVAMTTVCLNTELVFTDQSKGSISSYHWDFGLGADPRYADTEGPHVVQYKSSGLKTVRLVLNGLDEMVREDYLEVVRPPRANFSKTINHKTVTFRNTSSHADSYFWNFGDGVQVMMESPVHTYQQSGDYLVTLVAKNQTCPNDTTQQMVSFIIASADQELVENEFSIYPNPAEGWISIRLPEQSQVPELLELVDLQGRQILQVADPQKLAQPEIRLNLSAVQNGVYFVVIHRRDTVVYRKIIRR